MTPVLVNVTLQKHFITIIYPVAQQHWGGGWGEGGGGGLYGRSHTLTDIIVIDQSHRYVYVTSGASDQPEPRTPAAYGCARARASLLLSLGGWDRWWAVLRPSGCPAEAAVHAADSRR